MWIYLTLLSSNLFHVAEDFDRMFSLELTNMSNILSQNWIRVQMCGKLHLKKLWLHPWIFSYGFWNWSSDHFHFQNKFESIMEKMRLFSFELTIIFFQIHFFLWILIVFFSTVWNIFFQINIQLIVFLVRFWKSRYSHWNGNYAIEIL